MKNTNNTAKGLSTQSLILILGSLLIIAAAVVAVIVLTQQKPVEQVAISNPNTVPVVDESNVADIQQMLEEKVAKGMFETYMNTMWTFPDGKSASTDAVMGNSINNQYDFWFDVTLKDSGEEVFSSSLLPVGTSIKEIILSKELDKGSYDAVVKIHMVDENNEPTGGNAGFNITLVINE